jgi:hypothetical protein
MENNQLKYQLQQKIDQKTQLNSPRTRTLGLADLRLLSDLVHVKTYSQQKFQGSSIYRL